MASHRVCLHLLLGEEMVQRLTACQRAEPEVLTALQWCSTSQPWPECEAATAGLPSVSFTAALTSKPPRMGGGDWGHMGAWASPQEGVPGFFCIVAFKMACVFTQSSGLL